MSNTLVERALLRVAGGEHSVALDAVYGRIVGRQIEVGLHLVRVMTLETLVAKDRQHMVLIVYFVGGTERADGQQA